MEHRLQDLIKATWVKTRNIIRTQLLLTFNKVEVATYLQIPGEHLLAKVYEYKERPMICNKCLEIGHPKAHQLWHV